MSSLSNYSSQISDSDLIESINTCRLFNADSPVTHTGLFELPIELEYWRDSNVLQCHSSFPLTGPDPFNVDDEFQSKICSYQSTAGTANAAGTTNTGFTTATNRQINISTRSLKKARLLFQDHTDESLAPPSNAEQAIDGSEKIASFFTTASNKAIPISLNSLLKVNEFLLHPESPNWTEPPSSTAPTKFEEPQKVPKKDQMTMPCNENPAKPSLKFPNITKTKILSKRSTIHANR